jgi:cob(I)alamin adenosyltransferase
VGRIFVITGSGKGKTTAALGTVLRAVGHGLRVYVIFFMKGSDFNPGEFQALTLLPGVTTATFGQRGWIHQAHLKPEHLEQSRKGLELAREVMLSGNYDLVVLDEINVAVASGLVKAEDVIQLVKDKPEHVELILTGRDADPRLVQIADLVSEVLAIKHPYTEGVRARRGID